jgi:hypothetical protein
MSLRYDLFGDGRSVKFVKFGRGEERWMMKLAIAKFSLSCICHG